VLLETLISINGTKAEPVKGVTVQGITFRDAADITMNPWGVPSGGDWGLYRGGAIFFFSLSPKAFIIPYRNAITSVATETGAGWHVTKALRP